MSDRGGALVIRSVSARRRLCATAALASMLLCAPGCNGWYGRRAALSPPPDTREQVRLWVHGQAYQVHAVRVSGDSVTAVPFFRPPACDSCALRFALRDIDSVQVRAFDRDKTIFFIIIMTPVLVGFYLASQIPRD